MSIIYTVLKLKSKNGTVLESFRMSIIYTVLKPRSEEDYIYFEL